jgi:peptidoglycan/xylan/chitin deacetylase (PgdA/CDA1 family)
MLNDSRSRPRSAALVTAAVCVLLAVCPGVSRATQTPDPGTGFVQPPTVRDAPLVPEPPPPPRHPVVPTYVHRVVTRDRVVFLTIDDGWIRDEAFLALVRRQHLPVTVFLPNAATSHGHQGYFQRLHAAGAVIENHTLTHRDLTAVSATERIRQVCAAQDLDTRLFGTRPTLLRPPFGARSAAVMAAAGSCGIRAVVGWDAVMPAQGTLQTWYGSPTLHAGDIVLMHFHSGMVGQVLKLERIAAAAHLRFALLEDYLDGAVS